MTPGVQAILWAAVFLALVLASAFFSGIGAVTIAINRFRLRRDYAEGGDTRTQRVVALFDDAQQVLTVSLIGATVANIAALLALLLSLTAILHLGDAPLNWRTGSLALLVGIPIILVFGEVAPRRFFRERADRIVFWLYGPIHLSLVVFGPMARACISIAKTIGREEGTQGIDWLAHTGQRQAQFANGGDSASAPIDLETTEDSMIHGVFDLQKTRVREVMRPLVDLVAVRIPSNCGELRSLARATGYSRFPVYVDRITNLSGYVDIYDLLTGDPPDGQSLERFIRQAFYVPESKRLDDLFQELLDGHHKVAIVVDEYGGCSGWVTREDLLEEIVGEIEDEFDTGSKPIRRIDERTVLVSAAKDIDDLNEELGLRVPSDEADTLGGFVYDKLGRIPKVGDYFEDDSIRFEVTEMDGRRIVTLKLTLPSLELPASDS